MHGRNDDYMGNFIWRLQTAMNKIADNLSLLPNGGVQRAEIVLCDWGSETKLIDVLQLTDKCRSVLRYVYVPPDLARRKQDDSPYSSSHASNSAVRRASGKYVLLCDSDNYWLPDTMFKLWDIVNSDRFHGWNGASDFDMHTTFFWSARYHIPKDFHSACPSPEEIDRYIAENHHLLMRDKPDPHDFGGAANAMLIPRHMWYHCHGLDERMIHWGENDIQIHYRLLERYTYGGDLDDHGLKFYHLEHYARIDGVRNMGIENPRKANTKLGSLFQVNDVNWGLGEFDL